MEVTDPVPSRIEEIVVKNEVFNEEFEEVYNNEAPPEEVEAKKVKKKKKSDEIEENLSSSICKTELLETE